jgi:tetratricopeptide (TPR) repeat protein
MLLYLDKYIDDPKDYRVQFNLAYEYEQAGQLAAAIEFYLEVADNPEVVFQLQYESLIRAAHCYQKQGSREDTVFTLLSHAASISPDSIEAHYLFCKHYELSKDWFRLYMHACIGLSTYKVISTKPIKGLGHYELKFFKALAAWWIGKTEESREIMYELYLKGGHLQDLIFNNLRNIGYPRNAFAYKYSDMPNLYDKFRGYQTITKNYAQAAQDMFVITALAGKSKGTYLEIGSADPIMFNNTYMLEQDFDWTGTSVDIEPHHIAKAKVLRKNTAICADALTFDYSPYANVDYLQVDCEPPNVTFQILIKAMEVCRPKVITFEHDRYIAGDHIAVESRKLLSSLGYILKVKDVKFDNRDSQFEDWWILPELNKNVPRFEENILGIDYIVKKTS